VNLLRAFALSSVLVVSGAVFAAELAEPAGPPLSAAPPRAPPPRPYPSPPQRPRSAEADAAAYERCMTLAGEDPSAAPSAGKIAAAPIPPTTAMPSR